MRCVCETTLIRVYYGLYLSARRGIIIFNEANRTAMHASVAGADTRSAGPHASEQRPCSMLRAQAFNKLEQNKKKGCGKLCTKGATRKQGCFEARREDCRVDAASRDVMSERAEL